jgi:hypothetical protein
MNVRIGKLLSQCQELTYSSPRYGESTRIQNEHLPVGESEILKSFKQVLCLIKVVDGDAIPVCSVWRSWMTDLKSLEHGVPQDVSGQVQDSKCWADFP